MPTKDELINALFFLSDVIDTRHEQSMAKTQIPELYERLDTRNKEDQALISNMQTLIQRFWRD